MPVPADLGPASTDPASARPARTGPQRRRGLTETVITLLVAALLSVLLRTYACEIFYIPSASMVPALAVHDRIMVQKAFFDWHDVREGAEGAEVAATAQDVLTVKGLFAERTVVALTGNRVPFTEVSAHRAALEEACMELTRDAEEFRAAPAGGEAAAGAAQ